MHFGLHAGHELLKNIWFRAAKLFLGAIIIALRLFTKSAAETRPSKQQQI